MNLIRQKRERLIHIYQILTCVVLALLFVLLIWASVSIGLGHLSRLFLISYCFDVTSMLFCSAVFASSSVHDRDFEASTVTFKAMVFRLAATFFLEAMVWLLDGIPKLRVLNLAANELLILSGNISVALFWRYLCHLLELRDKRFVRTSRAFSGLFLLQVLLLLFNLPTHLLFSINAEGIWVRSDAYALSHLFDLLVLLVCVIVTTSTKMEKKQKFILVLYVAVPFAAGLISAFLPRMSLAHPAGFVAVIFCFAYIYLRKSNELTSKKAEMDFATGIQKSMLPRDMKDPDCRFEMIGHMYPAREVGGDFYDFYRLDEDHLAVLIADVSGKGLPAAMFMMKGISTLKNFAVSGLPVGEIMSRANTSLCINNKAEMFITAWMAVINEKTGLLSIVNAGHNFPVLKKADGSVSFVKLKSGIPLASFDQMNYRVRELKMEPGDTLLLYTDGVTEAHSRTAELFGDDRILKSVEGKAASPNELCLNLLQDVDRFAVGTDQFDDITMVAVHYKTI